MLQYVHTPCTTSVMAWFGSLVSEGAVGTFRGADIMEPVASAFCPFPKNSWYPSTSIPAGHCILSKPIGFAVVTPWYAWGPDRS